MRGILSQINNYSPKFEIVNEEHWIRLENSGKYLRWIKKSTIKGKIDQIPTGKAMSDFEIMAPEKVKEKHLKQILTKKVSKNLLKNFTKKFKVSIVIFFIRLQDLKLTEITIHMKINKEAKPINKQNSENGITIKNLHDIIPQIVQNCINDYNKTYIKEIS